MELEAGFEARYDALLYDPGEYVKTLVDDAVYMLKLYKETGEDHALAGFIKLFNKYLEAVSPLKYVPGLVERLGERVELRLWDVDFDYEALRRLMSLVYEVKDRGNTGSLEAGVRELAGLVSYFMAKVGVPLRELGGFNGLLGCRGCWTSDPSLMATLATVLLILATNP
ncbi:hypothetical protein [Desulfurococcus mucosus]|uniref:Uncharacterized protein n=1 Tax=Desulfurococcus mucosus (strain ATCC 35584 / DSM 2162 / JCM 9187 / O7/1) TaxID=765177 RepID=E8R864_DESM0|nr:hypothetical protein [Desulfurococcus mucosus]ADV64690.1 hypothetical protein Desmu_0371 [Desulfurococcus mucosus DSM 2162]